MRGGRPRSIGLPDGHSESEPPESISNSEVKGLCADGSVGAPHARVGHRQALIRTTGPKWAGFFCVPAKGARLSPDIASRAVDDRAGFCPRERGQRSLFPEDFPKMELTY